MTTTARLKKGTTVKQLLKKSYKTFPFEGKWQDSFGTPEIYGAWFVWGNSGNGKTSFIIQLCKELSKYGKICYNSLEEGTSYSMQKALKNIGLNSVGKKIVFYDETIEELKLRLDKPRSPKIVIIDSFQYTDFNRNTYLKFRKEYAENRLIVFTSHADGKRPDGRSANFAKHDAMVKIWVEGYRAFTTSRGFNTEPFDIYPERAIEYHGS